MKRKSLQHLARVVLTGSAGALLAFATNDADRVRADGDGGNGGNAAFGQAGGKGGSGFTGTAGKPGTGGGFGVGSGGGGGSAGGGAGGNGGGPAPGGAGGIGGTLGTPDGSDGTTGSTTDRGGGGGGGGANGNGAGAASLSNSATLQGGKGGKGGAGGDDGSGGGAAGGGGGGAGGYGAIVTGGGASSNNAGGLLQGGVGGAGGMASGKNSGVGSGGGSGGAGGVGIQFAAPGAVFTNLGTVQGGNGGIGGLGVGGGPNGTPGAGGTGVVGSNLTILNSGTIAAGLSGNGLLGNSVVFTGGTNVLNQLAGGKLLGNLTIGAGSTLTGTGTSTMTGAYTQTAGGTYLVNFAGASVTRFDITGAAALGGNLAVAGSGLLGTKYTVLTATGGVSGVFSSVVDSIPLTVAFVTYDGNDVYVTLISDTAFLSSFAQTPNQRSVAAAAGSATLSFLPALQGIAGNTATFRFALDQLSGEVHASNVTVGLENQSLFLRTLADRLRQGRCLCGDGGGCETDDAWHSWGTPFGQAGHADGNGNAHGFGYDSVGFAAGVERWIGSDTRVGIALGYDNWSNDTESLGSRSNTDSFLLGLYGCRQLGNAWLTGMVSYENDHSDTQRAIDFLASTARANTIGNQFGAYLEAGYAIPVGGLQIAPIGALQYVSLWRDSFSETGAGAAGLSVAGTQADSFRTILGGRLTYPSTASGTCISPELRSFWVHECADQNRDIRNQFVGGGSEFTIAGQNLGRDFGDLGVGVAMQLGRFRLSLNYDCLLSTNAVSHGGMGQVEWSW